MSKLISVSTVDLINEIDFEVVSFAVIDSEFDYYSLDQFLGKKIKDFCKIYPKYTAKRIVEENYDSFKGCFYFGATPIFEIPDYFYRIENHQIDIDLATRIGLGVVRMHTGNYAGEYLLYNVEENVFDDDEITMYDETIRISVYLTLTDDNYDSKELEKIMGIDEEEVSLLLISSDRDKLISEVRKAFKKKKGGRNVIQFKKRGDKSV